jgi:superfamily I DNA/RNA helicase
MFPRAVFVRAGRSLMVVGDTDQSIYAFRGANPKSVADFAEDFPT